MVGKHGKSKAISFVKQTPANENFKDKVWGYPSLNKSQWQSFKLMQIFKINGH